VLLTEDSNFSATESIIAMHLDGMILQESWSQKGCEQAMVTMENDLARYTPGQIDGMYVFGSIRA